jgi:CBS domain-containing protein
MSQSPSETILRATVDELRVHLPFSQMEAAHLAMLASTLTLGYYAKGEVILSPSMGKVSQVWILQRGTVKGERDAAATDSALTLNEGEMFPIGAAMSTRATILTFLALTDVFCYVLPLAAFENAMDQSRPFRHFATRRLAHLLDVSRRNTQQEFNLDTSATQTLASPLKSLIRRQPVTVMRDTPIHDVLQQMKSERIGSVVIVDDVVRDRAVGIFTERDVLDRVALPQIDQSLPIANVMTADPFSLPAHAPLFDAAKAMATYRFRHVLVTEANALIGIISERDLFAQQRLSLGQIAKSIERATSVEALQSAAQDVRKMARTLIAQGVAAEQLTQFVTTMNDAIVGRALQIAAPLRPPPDVSWCWLGLGSEGRMEQTLATDQDNALIFATEHRGVAVDIAATRERLLSFAEMVNSILDKVGFPLCRGDIMAKNPKWCLTEDEWRDTFEAWLRVPNPDALLNAAIFFDFRGLHGDAALADNLRTWLAKAMSGSPLLLRQMAVNALNTKPPLGMLRDFTDTDSEHPGTIDLKKYGARPFIDAARIFALAHHSNATNTADRLRAVALKLRLSDDEVSAYIDAFHFIQLLRLRLQPTERDAEAVPEKEAVSDKEAVPEKEAVSENVNPNRIEVDRLNELDRRILKEALRQARKLQTHLALDYQL